MITPKIKALFQFIEYLHSNIDNFKQYQDVINELHLLDKERQQVSPRKNFKDKLKYDEVQEKIKDKFKIIQDNILQPIKNKATELNICDLNETETVWNWNSTEIHQLKENFSKDDLPEILKHKQQYIEYREKTKGEAFFGLTFFFYNLDELLKELFDYFKETEQNEFEAFETKTVQANNIDEAAALLSIGKKSISFPFLPLKNNHNNKFPKFTTHEALYKLIIITANEKPNLPIEGAYDSLKDVWFFINSDKATFNGKEIEKSKRPLFVNPDLIGNKPNFEDFFNAEITFSSTQSNIKLLEQDFINDITKFINKEIQNDENNTNEQRKLNEFLEFINTTLNPEKHNESEQPKFSFKNNFDSIDEKTVYEHFKKGLVESKMISETNLQMYLKAAFEHNTPAAKRFTLKVDTKGKAIDVFYTYFKVIAGKPKGEKEDYVKLIGEYFEGYETSAIMSNFSKYSY
jgi:hypothetical protein